MTNSTDAKPLNAAELAEIRAAWDDGQELEDALIARLLATIDALTARSPEVSDAAIAVMVLEAWDEFWAHEEPGIDAKETLRLHLGDMIRAALKTAAARKEKA